MMQYENFDGNTKKQPGWMPWILGVTCVLFLAATGIAIFFATQSGSSSSSSSNSGDCTSAACIKLADSILSSIDDTADPCEDFFQYACGNWVDDNDWELVSSGAYSQFEVLSNYEMQEFLDALYKDTDESLVNHSSVLKSIDFYSACYSSDVTEEELSESQLFQDFISNVTFTDAANEDTWDDTNTASFIRAISWLSARSWNSLFQVSTLQTGVALISQDYETWLSYNSSLFAEVINGTYVPLYQSYFGLSETEANEMGVEVVKFADTISAITTASSVYYDQTYLYTYLLGYKSLGNLSQVFDSSDILNITEILFETFDSKKVAAVVYFTPDINFFNNLSTVLKNDFSPKVVQYFLYTDVLINAFNFEGTFEQSRSIDRVEFCFEKLLEQFPFIYGYVLDHVLFSTTKYQAIYDLVQTILTNGIRTVLNSATWMDASSLAASVLKVDNLGIYVGLPPKISNYTALDIYYSTVTQSNDDFVGNLGSLLDFAVHVTQSTFAGTIFDLISPWPSIFQDTSSYDSWLTGINAFYVPSGNFFTIPVTISQIPFFAEDYPSSVNYGGLGGVIGHEISHGFDPSGSFYNFNGSYGDIWTNETREAYSTVTDCFVTQYDGLEVEPGVYVNGTTTITENVADNGGLTASYTAWRSYISDNGDDESLPGVDLSSTQIFFWSWAHAWCEAYTTGYYDGWTDVHSPNPARVWGVVQNSDEFADAYSCASGSAMNPTSKCLLW